MTPIGQLADPNFRYSINNFAGTGAQTTWEISFSGGYLSRTHIKAVVTDAVGNTLPQVFTWVGDYTVHITPAVPLGHTLTIYRDTPKTAPLADFNDGSVVSEANLDLNARQAVFIAAEAIDRGEGSLSELAPRTILVPVGEVAPGLPPRSTLLGKLLGIDLEGNIVGISKSQGGGGIVFTSDDLTHDGLVLGTVLRQRISELALTTEELAEQAIQITAQAEGIALQAIGRQVTETALSQLRLDHESLVNMVDAIVDFNEGGGPGLATLIVNETAARTTADTALAAKLGFIGATNGDGTAFDLNLSTVKVSPTETLGSRLSQITANNTGAVAQIVAVDMAAITRDAAQTTARISLAASLRAESIAAIQTESTARSTAITAEATARNIVVATLRGEAAAASATEAGARSTAITAAINAEAATRAAGDVAEANARTSLAATLRSETAALVSAETIARSTALTAEALARTSLGTTLRGETSAQVLTESTARSALATSIASMFTLLGGVTTGGAAFQLNEATVRVAGGVALGTRLSGIDTQVAGNTAAISAESAARTTGLSAEASARAAIIATVRGEVSTGLASEASARNAAIAAEANARGAAITAAVLVESTARVSAVGAISVKYGVTLDGNGYISGYSQNNNGVTSGFNVRADTFGIAMPGQTTRIIFGVDSRGVTINGDLFMGTGRIVSDTGIRMRVMGTGFGTSNQFIDWYGPSRADLNLCNELDALYYLTIDGRPPKFGGGINNSADGTLATTNASTTLGPFGTPGGAKSVEVVYTYSRQQTSNYNTGTVSGSGSAVLVVERSGDGASWTTVGNLTVPLNGSVYRDGDPSIRDEITVSGAGSTSFTDNAGATTSLFFRGRLTSHTLPTIGGSGASAPVINQLIRVSSRE